MGDPVAPLEGDPIGAHPPEYRGAGAVVSARSGSAGERLRSGRGPTLNYSYPLYCSCLRNGDRVALVGRAEEVTYAELERRIAGLGAGLRSLGLAGKAVAALTGNEPEAVELYMALARAGAVAVPLNTRLAAPELRFALQDSEAVAIVADPANLAVARELAADLGLLLLPFDGPRGDGHSLHSLRATDPGPPPGADDGDERAAATIIYTSGTTGLPKGVVRSHRANAWNAVNSALGAPRTPDDVEVFNLPVFGIGFLHFLMPALLGGATVVLDRAFEPARAWELLERHRATRTFLAPTMISAMLAVEGHEERDLSALEIVYTAYAFPERLRRTALHRFGPVFVYMYGLTEAQLTCARREDFVGTPSSVGRSMGVSEVAVLGADGGPRGDGEVGEIAFAGPSLMSSYHGRPEDTATALDGRWLRTGDLGRIDAGGDLHYVGRSKEMIKTGGFSVDPAEVENAILEREEVVETAVVGVEDEHWGEEVVAFVVIARGSSFDADELRAECRERIAAFKLPKRVFFVDDLPKNPTGKVERGALRERAGKEGR
jgi:acyl-CoA synthetase (AMP-forming)/AMP-acid ligase II